MHLVEIGNNELSLKLKNSVMDSNLSKSNRWDDDTEDSGVDSVSSVRESDTSSSPTNNNAVQSDKSVHYSSHKSFLHTVYGSSIHRPLNQLSEPQRSADSVRFHAVRNKLEQLITKYSVANGPNEPRQATVANSEKLSTEISDPQVKDFLDSIEIQPTGPDSLLLITRDGMRASLRLAQKTGLNRVHRGSKRSSQKRLARPSVPGSSSSCGSGSGSVPNEAVNKEDASSSAPNSEVKIDVLRKTNVAIRRRPSQQNRDRSKMAFTVSMPMTKTKVAVLTSKFNSMISESKSSSTVTQKSRVPRRIIEPIPEAPAGTTETEESEPVQKANLDGSHRFTEPQTEESRTVQDNQDDSAKLNNSHGVYDTVKSIVKQAIRKFEKTEPETLTPNSKSALNPKSGSSAVPEASTSGDTSASATYKYHTYTEPKLPDGVTPNTSFLWRNRQSTQNLIYEATIVTETSKTTNDCSKSSSYYDLEAHATYEGTSNAYDTLTLKPKSTYDNQLSGYDPVGPPQLPGYDPVQNPVRCESQGTFSYDDIKSPAAAYDELNYKRRPSHGYDELQTTSDGYIDPSSSSALGYERLLNTSSDYGSTLRYEVCETPAFGSGLQASGIVTALPAVVIEHQMDSILYDDIHGYGGSHHSYEPIYAHLKTAECVDKETQQQSQIPEANETSADNLSECSESGTHEVFSYRLVQMGSGTVPDSPAPSMAASRTGTEQPSEGSDEWVDISDPEEPLAVIVQLPRDSVRLSVRGRGQSRRRLSSSKNNRPWSKMRAFVKNKFNKTAPEEAVNNKVRLTKPSAVRVPSCGTEGSSATFEDYGESERDDASVSSHDDNIYEVIGPQVKNTVESTDYSDSSFDSDDPLDDGNYNPNQDSVSERSKERPSSQSESYRSKEGEDPSMKLRFVQVAGRIKENWSSTKSGISKSIKRIKKRSTVTVTDLSELLRMNFRERSPEKTPKSQATVTSPKSDGKKETWTFAKMKKAASASALRTTSRSSVKESSKFYVTVTIEKDQQPKSPEPQAGTSDSPVPPLVKCRESPAAEEVPPRPRRSSSINRTPTTTVRPKTAPPEPPKARSSEVIATAQIHQRITHSSSESQLRKPRDSSSANQTNYSDLIISSAARREEPAQSTPNTPYSRLSWASSTSRNSTENYMGLDDVASTPQNHGNLFPVAEDSRSYLDLQAPSEAEEMYVSSHFADEPLYQFYTASIIERATHNQGEGSEEDDYEVIGENHYSGEDVQEVKEKKRLPSAMELVAPGTGRRTLWCELPEVINSGVLETITAQQRKLQEAMFEVITSEASYLRSLNVLMLHFIQSPEFSAEAAVVGTSVLNRVDRETLFGDIVPVRECSERLLADLEKRWQESAYIREICDIVLDHASKHFSVYVKYCSNQLHQERKLRELKEKNPQFIEALRRLESNPVCQSLAMHSFLMLPMQRITRLPLLVDAIFHRLDHGTPEYERCQVALAKLNRIVQECNEGARKAERLQEMLIVSNQLDFADVKAISIMSASRWLVKKGEMQRLFIRDLDAKLTFGRKFHRQTVYLFLFNDLLVVTKKKNDECYAVLDYCPRNMVAVDEYRSEKTASKTGNDSMKNLVLLTMLENHERKEIDMILACSSESDRTRWLEAVTPRISENPEEKIYEEWDCPQVQAVHSYVATQPDELSLDKSDVVNVLRKMADGWYQGERLRDGERGWFPGNYTVEIASAHVRARNLRQRYRLLALSGNFLEEQSRREKEEQRKRSKKLSLE